MYSCGHGGIPSWAHTNWWAYPCITIICLVGIYSVRNSIFDVWVMIAARIVGFFLRQWALPIAPFIIGMVLGPTTEASFRQTLMLFKGNVFMVFDRPVALGFLAAILFCITGKILYQIFGHRRSKSALQESIGQ